MAPLTLCNNNGFMNDRERICSPSDSSREAKKRSRFSRSAEIDTSEPLKAALTAAYVNEDTGYGAGSLQSVEYSVRLGEDSAPVGSPLQYPEHHGNFAVYIATKRARLAEQGEARVTKKSTIFRGLVVFVNGHTSPAADELQAMVLEHGGQVENTLSTNVTHVVCENLAASKLRKVYQATKALKRKIVSPAWVVDSVKNRRLMSVTTYVFDTQPNNHKILSFVGASADPAVVDALPASVCASEECLQKSVRIAAKSTAKSADLQRTDDRDAIPLFAPASCGFDRVEKAIVLWMHRARRPSDLHVALLVELLAMNVAERRLDDVACILRLVNDVAVNELPRWKPASLLAQDLAQHMVRSAYSGARLVLHSCQTEAHNADDYYFHR